MTEKLVLSALVENHYGVLLRVAGLFSRRGFNISSLTVCETEDPAYSRMTIVSQAEPSAFRQVEKQLLKLEDVKRVVMLCDDNTTGSELLLIKVKASEEARAQVINEALAYGARVMDVGDKTMTVELTGMSKKLDSFINDLSKFEICELARTGLNALERGDRTIKNKADI